MIIPVVAEVYHSRYSPRPKITFRPESSDFYWTSLKGSCCETMYYYLSHLRSVVEWLPDRDDRQEFFPDGDLIIIESDKDWGDPMESDFHI